MIITEFYKAIMARITNQVPQILYFDMWNNQFENSNPEGELPFDMPAVFLEYAPIQWTQLGSRKQLATVDFLLHVASVELGEASSLDTELQQDAHLAHFELQDKVFAALQNFNGNMVSPKLPFGSISRTGSNIDHNHDGVMIHAIPFRVVLYDEAATAPTTVMVATAEVTVIRDNDLDPETEN